MFNKIAWLGLLLFLILVFLPQRSWSQNSGYLEIRLSRLESDTSQLRSQLNRLESQLASGNLPNSSRAPALPAPPPERTSSQIAADPAFKRLATLVIELKQRVNKLEAQLQGR